MRVIRSREFTNGKVYAIELYDGFKIETTDTFLPEYTRYATGGDNSLHSISVGDRSERWMVGVSVMSGCPVGCKFCATGNMSKWRNLTSDEMIQQVQLIMYRNATIDPRSSKEFKINYTRMGEPFLNINAVKKVIDNFPFAHNYISTIGLKDADYSWIENNTSLQISLHALSDERRDWLIPYKNKATIAELGKIRTRSKLKTTINLTLVDDSDFNINVLRENFDPEYFFIKLSPINKNFISDKNKLGDGVVTTINLL